MKTQHHILNGDSLKQQFPKSIRGELIVARECLVDGNVKGSNLAELFDSRAQFISQHYDGFSQQDYYENTVPEFTKMQTIASESEICLWFEDDLFCQVNLWFVLHLLRISGQENPISLVRPRIHTQYGFGGLSESELISIYENRVLLKQIDELAKLWLFY
ncbi:MAG: hypothetical protein ACJAWV_001727 [Flammeovirgaceae bacterium]|jgi:hypothetical protein